MVFYKRRDRFSSLSARIGIAFSKFGLSPNQWTFLSIVPVIIAVYFLVQREFILAAVFFIIASFLDLVDGSVARVTGNTSIRGAYLDTIVDRYIEGIILFGILFINLPGIFIPIGAWIFIYLFGSFMTTYSKAAAMEKKMVEKEIKGGLLERAERLIILFVGILLASLDPLFLAYVVVLLAVLTNITGLQRIAIAFRQHEKEK